MDKLRIGFIGCGNIAQNKHLPALVKRDDTEICGFCSASMESARKAKSAFGNKKSYITNDPMRLIKDQSIDVIYNCTPNHLHTRYSIMAMENGKHVVCEKPMACNYYDAQLMVHTSIRTNKVLNIAFQNRFSDNALYIKELYSHGYLGEAYHVDTYAVRRRGIPTWNGFINSQQQCVGALGDIGSHTIDLTLWITNNYKPTYALAMTYNKIGKLGSTCNRWGAWNPSSFSLEDSVFGTVLMENGLTISINAAWALNTSSDREGCISLYGCKAGIEMYPDRVLLIEEKNGRLCETIPAPSDSYKKGRFTPSVLPPSPADRETDYYIGSIKSGNHTNGNAKEALVVSQIMNGLYESAKTMKPYCFK